MNLQDESIRPSPDEVKATVDEVGPPGRCCEVASDAMKRLLQGEVGEVILRPKGDPAYAQDDGFSIGSNYLKIEKFRQRSLSVYRGQRWFCG